MAIYTVHLPPDAASAEQVADKAAFVKEGFSFKGFVFTGLWLLSQRLWLLAIGYGVIFAGLMAAVAYVRLPAFAFTGTMFLLALLIGLEGHEWVRRRFRRSGWIHAGTVSGPSLEECERRFFKDWTAGRASQPVARPPAQNRPEASAPMPQPQVMGLFPTPRSSG